MTRALVVLILALGAPGAGLESQSGTAPAGKQFAWLEGCWGGERGTTRFREIWTVASPDLLLGMGVTTDGAKPAEFDYFRIEQRGEGAVYVAQPRGVPPTVFTLNAAGSSPDEAMFVNPAHDF